MEPRSNAQPSESFVNLRRQHTKDRIAALFICWSAALGLIAGVPAAIGQAPGPTPSPAPTQRTFGIYLTAISNVDTRRDSFIADFYIWTTSPANAPDPLATVSIVRARTQTILYEWKEKFGEWMWSLRKYRCEILDNWDFKNFPFDDHILIIAVIPDADEPTSLNYQVDEKNSGTASEIASGEWRLSNFKVFTQNIAYGSNFGDPHAATPYNYNAASATFLLTRKPWRLFIKLMAGSYLAAAAALLGCYMKTTQPPVFSGRMGLQIGCLFAAIINHREISNLTGQKDIFILPDALQLSTYLLIFASLVLTLRSRRLTESNQEARGIRTERRITLCLALLFLLFNVASVWRAIVATPNSNRLQIFQVGD